ncbi:MAG: helix-turn-helix transcriptional regulator [Chloroflexi bacterium]|nr:helix-turn-helix transcriptional regulator [Chloroflexota bacterium]
MPLACHRRNLLYICGVHRTYTGQIERGEKTVTIETASRLAHALGLSLSDLFANLGGG